MSSEEDGGLGTFAELERDAAFDAALIPEPTGFAVVCAQAGALTFRGVVPGRAAHAAHAARGPLGDRPLRRACTPRWPSTSGAVNAGVAHPLMRELALPYPLLVGRVEAGAWSSQVPDRLEFEGRLGVPVGADPAAARAAFEAVVARALDDGDAPAEITWTGGAFAPAETPPEHPWVAAVAGAFADELGRQVAPGRRAVGRGHAPLHRPRHPVHDGRDARHRARPRRRRARRARASSTALARATVRVAARAARAHLIPIGPTRAGRGRDVRQRAIAHPGGMCMTKGNLGSRMAAGGRRAGACSGRRRRHIRRGGRSLRPVGGEHRAAAEREDAAGRHRAAPRPAAPAAPGARNMSLVGNSDKDGTVNSDLAFWGNLAYSGNYDGFRILDIKGQQPRVVVDFTCSGPQNDVSVYEMGGSASCSSRSTAARRAEDCSSADAPIVGTTRGRATRACASST